MSLGKLYRTHSPNSDVSRKTINSIKINEAVIREWCIKTFLKKTFLVFFLIPPHVRDIYRAISNQNEAAKHSAEHSSCWMENYFKPFAGKLFIREFKRFADRLFSRALKIMLNALLTLSSALDRDFKTNRLKCFAGRTSTVHLAIWHI